MLKHINSVFVFLLELAMLAIFACYGYSRGSNVLAHCVIAGLLLTVVIVLWSILAAPKSARRLRMPYVVFFRVMMFLISAFLMYRLGYKNIAILITIMTLITQTISYFVE